MFLTEAGPEMPVVFMLVRLDVPTMQSGTALCSALAENEQEELCVIVCSFSQGFVYSTQALFHPSFHK